MSLPLSNNMLLLLQCVCACVREGLWATEGGEEWGYLKQDRLARGQMKGEGEKEMNGVTESRWEGTMFVCLHAKQRKPEKYSDSVRGTVTERVGVCV